MMTMTTPAQEPVAARPLHAMPFVRLELVVLALEGDALSVLLAKRQEAPYRGRWALPGGVLRIDLDADLAAAAQRVAGERLGQRLPNLSQVLATGGPTRDPRAPWALSVVYRALVPGGQLADVLTTAPGKRVAELQWRSVQHVQQARDLAFDHGELVDRAVQAVRAEVAAMAFPSGWLPEQFTIGQLQVWSEAVLGKRLDKVTFRRRLTALQTLEPVPGVMRLEGAHRPGQVYQLASALGN